MRSLLIFMYWGALATALSRAESAPETPAAAQRGAQTQPRGVHGGERRQSRPVRFVSDDSALEFPAPPPDDAGKTRAARRAFYEESGGHAIPIGRDPQAVTPGTEYPTEGTPTHTVAGADQPIRPSAQVKMAALPLTPRNQESNLEAGGFRAGGPAKTSAARGTLVSVAASLGLVLGLFLIVAWFMRRAAPGVIPLLPKNVVEVLGRLPMAGRHQMQLLRLGDKLLLVHLSLNGAETLSEITDPEQVDRLAGYCLQSQSHSSTRLFRDVLSSLGREKPGSIFDSPPANGAELAGSEGSGRGYGRGGGRGAYE